MYIIKIRYNLVNGHDRATTRDPVYLITLAMIFLFIQDCQAISCVEIREYEDIFDDLSNLSNNWENVLLGKKWAYSGGASYAVYGFIPESKRKLELSPIMLMKAQKNEVSFNLGVI